jgi:hypothetical protein
VIFQKLRSLIAQWRAEEIDEQMGKLLPVESSILFTRRRFLQTVVPAALVMPVLAEELLHPGRVTFLPPAPSLVLNGQVGRYENISIYQSGQSWDIEAIVKRQLSLEAARRVDVEFVKIIVDAPEIVAWDVDPMRYVRLNNHRGIAK